MIKRKDVITIKVPFPSISSGLAVNAHMYICREVAGSTHKFIKCQTLKPGMLTSTVMQHYWDEQPDITRNPFAHLTRIDCDKEFVTTSVQYNDALKTKSRPDVCDDIMVHVESEFFSDGYLVHNINEANLLRLNHLITTI